MKKKRKMICQEELRKFNVLSNETKINVFIRDDFYLNIFHIKTYSVLVTKNNIS